MGAYSNDINPNLLNMSINGFDMVIEEPSPSESYNRRETSRHNIIGGTQWVARTTYIPRDFTFQAHLKIDPLYPDIYDSMIMSWMNGPVEVVSNELGGKFNAECIVKKTHESPSYLTLEIQLIEVPGETSNIPNEKNFKIPDDKITTTVTSSSNKNKKKNNKKKNKKGKKGKKGNKVTRTK